MHATSKRATGAGPEDEGIPGGDVTLLSRFHGAVRRRAAAESDLLRMSRELRRAHQELDAVASTAEALRTALSAERDRAERSERRAEALEGRAEQAEHRAEEAGRRSREQELRSEEAERRAGAIESDLRSVTAERDRLGLELDSVRASRLFRLGALYWRLLRRLGLLPPPAPAPQASAPAPVGPAADARPVAEAGPPAVPGPLPAAPPAIPALPSLPRAPEPELPVPPAPAPAARPSFRGERPAPALPDRADVVCFSIIEWDFLFQRPQQLLSRLAERGHRVFYVSAHLRSPDAGPRVYRARERVYEVLLGGTAIDFFRDEPSPADVEAMFASLRYLVGDLGLSSPVALVHHPFWWPLVERVRRELGWPLAYDCMDHHSGFRTNQRPVEPAERELVAAADLLVTSSRLLHEELGRSGRRVALLPNGVDVDYFESVRPRPRPRRERPVLGYFGAIADWFDADLVADLAERRPDWDFVLIGPTSLADLTRLARLPNVRFPGFVAYGELAAWLDGIDVFLLPFRRTPLTEATNPVKAYEILAAGRPLVSVDLPELAPCRGLVRFGNDAADFEHEVLKALDEDDPGLVEARRAFARRSSWDERAAVLDGLLATLAPHPVQEA